MFALDEIQRGDTRRERIDGGIASRRFEKSRTMGQRKLKYGRRRGNGPLRPDTHPWHVKLSVLRSANFRSMDPTIVEPIRFPFPTSLASYIRACICPWKWQNYRTTTVHVTGIMSVGWAQRDFKSNMGGATDHEFVLAIRVFAASRGNIIFTIEEMIFFQKRNYIRERIWWCIFGTRFIRLYFGTIVPRNRFIVDK